MSASNLGVEDLNNASKKSNVLARGVNTPSHMHCSGPRRILTAPSRGDRRNPTRQKLNASHSRRCYAGLTGAVTSLIDRYEEKHSIALFQGKGTADC